MLHEGNKNFRKIIKQAAELWIGFCVCVCVCVCVRARAPCRAWTRYNCVITWMTRINETSPWTDFCYNGEVTTRAMWDCFPSSRLHYVSLRIIFCLNVTSPSVRLMERSLPIYRSNCSSFSSIFLYLEQRNKTCIQSFSRKTWRKATTWDTKAYIGG